MKKFCVIYSVTTSYDASVSAKNAEEAKKKIIEVIGDDAEIDGAWEIKSEAH